MSALVAVSVAGYEIRRLLRDRSLAVLLILLLVLSGYAGWNGADWVQQREAAIALIEAQEQDSSATRRQFILQSYSSVILPVAQPVLRPGAMAPLSVGLADAYPFSAHAAPLGDYSDLFRRVWSDIGSPTVRAAGRFDLAFVVVFLLPLILLAATYDLWSRERERGVAAMVLSQPVTIGMLISMKALARGVTVLVPSIIIILVVAVWAGARQPSGLTALALTILAYGGFWLTLAVIINLVTRRSTEAAIAAGAAWLLVVVMAPSLTFAAIDLIAPAPSEMRFATELKIRKAEITERQARYRDTHPRPAQVPAPRIPERLRDVYADHVALDNAIAPMIATHQQLKSARRYVLDRVRFFLPSVAVQDALDRIAGSDADRALAFESQVRAAQLKLRHVYKSHLDRDTLVTLTDYDQIPTFRFRETDGALQLSVLADLAAVFITTLIILIVARALRGRAAMP